MHKSLIINIEGIQNRLNIYGETTARVAAQTIVYLCLIHLEWTQEPCVPYPPFPAILLVNMVEATLLFAKGKDRGPHTLEFRISSTLRKCVGQEGPSH